MEHASSQSYQFEDFQSVYGAEDLEARWDLSFLYQGGLDDPEVSKDLEKNEVLIQTLLDLAAQLNELKEGADNQKVFELLVKAHQAEEKLTLIQYQLGYFLMLNYEADTTNNKAQSLITCYESQLARLAPYKVALAQTVSRYSIEELCAVEGLTAYEYRFRRIKEEASHQLSAELEEMAAYLSLCGGDAWGTLHSSLTSTLKVPYKDKIMGLDIRDLAYSPDPEVRKSAFEAEYAAYDQIELPIAAALNSLKKQVKYLAARRGYKDALHESAAGEDMSEETLNALISAMDKNLGVFHRYLKAKAKMMGHSNGLPFYDLFAPTPNDTSSYNSKECHDILVKAFSELHEPIAAMMNRAFVHRWIDFFPRDGKVGGAFCCNMPYQKQSVVLHNYDNTTNALLTMAHELGHAYHGECIQCHSPLNYEYGMTVAETASTFNETHLVFYLLKNSENDSQRLAALEIFLQGITQTVCDIYSRFLFEREVFERCDQEYLNPDALRDIMKRAQIKAYGEGLDHNHLHPNMWIPKGHYYSAQKSFYNYPYAFGSLLSMGLYNKISKQEISMEDYDTFLRATTVSSVEECGDVVGIKLSDEAFWTESIKAFEPFIDEYEQITARITA